MDTNKDYSTLTTIGGYAVLAIAGGLWWLSHTRKTQQQQSARQPVRHLEKDSAAESKKKLEKAAKPKSKPKALSSNEPTTSLTESYVDLAAEEAAEKKAAQEFARQSESTRTGTQFTKKADEKKRQKSVKQSKAQEVTLEKTSAPSSTTGDADDDLSPQASPVVVATDNQGGVADMLEPASSGPSVLRLTDTDSAKPKVRQSKPFEPAETKKQRQNRKKAEAAKAAREEDEKERKVLMEQQRRTARIAEGRPAKDGSAFTNTQNAWTAKPTNGSAPVQLLDTIEKKPETQATMPGPSKPAAAKQAEVSDAYANLPSEEEQLEMIRQEDSWNEVKTKKKGKKKESGAEALIAPSQLAAPISKPATNGAKKPILTSSSSSFAALTTDDAEDDSEAEQEWDV
ncbi:hypothetical protein F5Y16DRAFT_388011 [Xylariaceae sp. FL0255]|nr:hypothetical protein F5Y16DRAFT_388011 [Xylariaceae sp. FL0255]